MSFREEAYTPTGMSYLHNLLKAHLYVLNWHKCRPSKLHSKPSPITNSETVIRDWAKMHILVLDDSLEVRVHKRIILLPGWKRDDNVEMCKLLL